MSRAKIKVVWLCTPWSGVGGGTWRRLMNWTKFLDWERFEVTLVLGGPVPAQITAAKQYFEPLGPLEVMALDGLNPVSHWPLMGLRQLRQCLQAIAPDILHTIFIQSDIAGGLVRRKAGVPIHVSSLEGALVPWFTTSWKRVLYKIGYAWVQDQLDAIIALCQTTRDQAARDFGAPLDKMQVIYSGLDLREFSFKSGWPYVSGQRPRVIGTIARLSQEKNVKMFVTAAPHVLERHPDLCFVIGGSGPEEANLKALTRELGVRDRFNFLGWIDQAPTVLQTFDVFVFTSTFGGAVYEGLPWSVLEAQAVGVPTIASAVGGVPEVIDDGLNGFLLRENSPLELAERTVWLLQNREVAAEMGISGRRVIESRFSIEREVGEIQGLYESLHSRPPRGAR